MGGVGEVEVPHVPHGPAYGLPKLGRVGLGTRAFAVDVEIDCKVRVLGIKERKNALSYNTVEYLHF